MTSEEIIKLIDERIRLFLQLFERDFWDYAAIIAPFVLSVVAIFISIYTIRKQTKSDLFEKRYSIIYTLGFLIQGSENVILKNMPAKDFWKVGMDNYKSMNSLSKSDYDDNEALNFYFNLIFQVMKISCLFPEKKIKNINKFSEIFMNYISNLFLDKETKYDEEQLRVILDLMEREKTLDKLDKYLKIW